MCEPIDPERVAANKRMTPREKLEKMAQLWQEERERIAACVRTEHPDWNEEAVWEEVRLRLIYGPEDES